MFNFDNFLLALAMCIISALLSFFAAVWLMKKKRSADMAAAASVAASAVTATSESRTREMERQIAVLGQTVLPISTAFQAILIKQLTHYHTPELDALLQKIGPPFTLNALEERQLAILLEARTLDVGGLIDSSERDAATMLPLVMARVRAEYGSRISDMELMLVAVNKTVEK